MISVIIPVTQHGQHARRTTPRAVYPDIRGRLGTDRSRQWLHGWHNEYLPEMGGSYSNHAPGGRFTAARLLGRAQLWSGCTRGSVFAFCDADDVVHPEWLEHCAAAAHQHDHIAGALDPFSLNPFAVPKWEAGALSAPPLAMSFKPFAIGANMVVSRRAFMQVGGFCESLQVSQDVDFSWRVQLAGYPLHFEPGAVVAKRYRRNLRQACRQSMEWGIADVELYRQFRQFGLEFPVGVGPLYSDCKGAFSRTSGWHIELNSRTLVVALAHNIGRVLGCSSFGRSIIGHGCGTDELTRTRVSRAT